MDLNKVWPSFSNANRFVGRTKPFQKFWSVENVENCLKHILPKICEDRGRAPRVNDDSKFRGTQPGNATWQRCLGTPPGNVSWERRLGNSQIAFLEKLLRDVVEFVFGLEQSMDSNKALT